MINRKDLWLLVLILVVGTVVAIINPRFLSPVNLSNTANLIGLFGILARRSGLRHHGRRHRTLGGFGHRAGRLHLLDLIAGGPVVSGVGVVLAVLLGCPIGLVHGLLVARVGLQPFMVTLLRIADLPRRGARLHRRPSAGFPSAQARGWWNRCRGLIASASRLPGRFPCSSPRWWASSSTAPCSAATFLPSARTNRPRATAASTPPLHHRCRIRHLLQPGGPRGDFSPVHAVGPAIVPRQLLRALGDRGGGAGGLSLRGGEGSILGVVLERYCSRFSRTS